MKKQELQRLAKMEEKILQIAAEEGMDIGEKGIIFEVVPPRRMIEGMAYGFPTNISHWTFGRDFDQIRTIYEYTGAGIPYEQVWNYETPVAFIDISNPFALKVLTMSHVVGHVDFFRRNIYSRHGRSLSDIAEEARLAAERFRRYESKYGKERVEAIIDAGMSLRWHQPKDLLAEEPSDADARAYDIALVHEKIKYVQSRAREIGKERAEQEIQELERERERLQHRTPPRPVYDILRYVIEHAPRLRNFERDVLTVLLHQSRSLAQNRATKMLNEGWATYGHVRIMRQLFAKGLLSADEHSVFVNFHNKVTQQSKASLNVYNVGPAFYEYAEMLYDKGRFGREYDECLNPEEKARWDTGAMKGREKIFQISGSYTDHVAIMEFFTPEFIRALELYIYEARLNRDTGDIEYVIVQKDPEVIRRGLMQAHSFYGMPSVKVVDGNYGGRGELHLKHEFLGLELEDQYTRGTLQNAYYAWRRPVHLETVANNQQIVYTYDGKQISINNGKFSASAVGDGLVEL